MGKKKERRQARRDRRNHRWRRVVVALPAGFMLAAACMGSKADAQPPSIASASDASGSRWSRDLSDVGTAKDVCEVIAAFYKEGHIQEVLFRQSPETQVKNDASLAEVHGLMTDRGWIAAARGDYGISNYRGQAFEIRRVHLTDEAPPAWVFSTSVGSLHNPLHWVLSSTPDGKRADRLLLRLGFEASGHFDTAFVRFHGAAFAVGIWDGEVGPSAEVYRLDPGRKICAFDPRQ